MNRLEPETAKFGGGGGGAQCCCYIYDCNYLLLSISHLSTNYLATVPYIAKCS